MIEVRRSDTREVFINIPIGSDAKRVCKLMGDDYVELKFKTVTPVNFRVGDYFDSEIFGRFIIASLPSVSFTRDDGGYEYTVKFEAPYRMWKNRIVKLIPTVGASEASFSTTDSIETHASIILQNLKAYGFFHYADNSDYIVKIGSDVKSEHKLITYQNIDIYSALTKIAETYETEWWVSGNVINFGKCDSLNPSVDFELGKNVANISQSTSGNPDYATRFYFFGSTKNIPDGYRKQLYFEAAEDGSTVFDAMRPINRDWFRDLPKLNSINESLQIKRTPKYVDISPVLLDKTQDKCITELAMGWVQIKDSHLNTDIDVDISALKFRCTRKLSEVGITPNSSSNSSETIGLIRVISGKFNDGTVFYQDGFDEIRIDDPTLSYNPVLTDDTILLDFGKLKPTRLTFNKKANRYITEINVFIKLYSNQTVEVGNTELGNFIKVYSPDQSPASFITVQSNGKTYSDCWMHVDKYPLKINLPIDLSFKKGQKYTLPQLDIALVPGSFFSLSENSGYVKTAIAENRLMLPTTDANGNALNPWIDIKEHQSDSELIEKVVVIEDVYPKPELIVDSVSAIEVPVTDKDGLKRTDVFYSVSVADFRYDNRWTLGEYPKILFQSGSLNGMEFDAIYHSDRAVFELKRNETYGRPLPDAYLCPKKDDKFILYGWNTLSAGFDTLVRNAELELLKKGKEYIDKLKIDPANFPCEMMPDYIYLKGKVGDAWKFPFGIGDKIKLINSHLFPEKGYRESRIVEMECKLSKPFNNPIITLGDKPSYSKLGEMAKSIKDITVRIDSKTSSTTSYSSQSDRTVTKWGDISDFSEGVKQAVSENDTIKDLKIQVYGTTDPFVDSASTIHGRIALLQQFKETFASSDSAINPIEQWLDTTSPTIDGINGNIDSVKDRVQAIEDSKYAARITDLETFKKNHKDYTLPAAKRDELGGIKIGYTATDKNYPVELNDDSQAYVTVPWENTTYTKATKTQDGLLSKEDKIQLEGLGQNLKSKEDAINANKKNIADVQKSLSELSSTFNSMFEIVGDKIHAKKGLYTHETLSALGMDSTVGGSTVTGVSYPRLDSWAETIASNAVLSATLGKELKDAVDGHTNQIAEVNTKLQGKSDSSHTHDSVYSKTSHKHVKADISDLSLDWSAITDKPTAYDPKVHNHNDTYYTEKEIDNKLDLKVNASDVGNVSGQIAVNFSFPDYHTLGTPGGQNEVYFKTLLKWLKAKYPTRELRFSGLCRPGMLGSLTLTMYNEAANADGIPQYCSGYYVSQNTNRGVIFGYNNYQWYYKQQAAFEDIAWGNLTGKPSTFTPATHSHTKSEITDFAHDHNNTYLGINAKATDSAKLDGQLPSYYAKATDLTWGKIGNKPTTVGELGLTNFKVGYYEGKLDDIPTNGLYRLGTASVVPDLPYSSLNSQWSTLLHLCPNSDEKAQILVSYLDSTMYVRGGGTNLWRRWTKILSDNNYTEYAPKKTDYDAFVSAFNKAFTIADDGSVTAKVGLSSLGWLSAKGSDTTSVGGSGVSYPRLDSWSAYNEGDGSILSAKLGKGLKDTVTGHTNQIAEVNTKLQGKSDSSHTHDSVYSKTSHKHVKADISDLSLDWSAITDKPTAYDPKVHNHNDTYYTEKEIDNKLDLKVNASDVGNVSGQIAVNFSFPDYHTLGTPGGQNEVYFKTLLKWLKAKYPTRELRFSGICRPGMLGSLTLTMYNEAANADGIPQYCSGYYVSQNTNRGVIFGYNNYQWYYKQQAAFEDIAWGNLTGKPSTFTPATHSHLKSEITDFAHDHNGSYLGIEATATDSAKLDGQLPSYYAKAADLTWSKIGSKPTTLSGYGITDFKVSSYVGELANVPKSGIYRLGSSSVIPDLPDINFQYASLLHLDGWGDSRAQILISYRDSAMMVRGGNPGDTSGTWKTWTKILSDKNFNQYAPTKEAYDAFVTAFNKAFIIADDGSVTAKVGLSSLGYLSAKGTDSTSVGGSGASYGRIDAWSDLVNTDTTSVPQAKLVRDSLATKVDKADGMGLSSNDYTASEKAKLAGIADGANNYKHPNKHTIAEVDGLKGVLDGKSNSTHNHDEVYSKLGHTHAYLPLAGGTMSNTNLVKNLNANYLDGWSSVGKQGKVLKKNCCVSVGKGDNNADTCWYKIASGATTGYNEHSAILLISEPYHKDYYSLVALHAIAYGNCTLSILSGTFPASSLRLHVKQNKTEMTLEYELWVKCVTEYSGINVSVLSETGRSSEENGCITLHSQTGNNPTPPTFTTYVECKYSDYLGNASTATDSANSAKLDGKLPSYYAKASDLTSHLNSTSAHSFDHISNKPTTLQGYGITDAMTATDITAKIKAVRDYIDSLFVKDGDKIKAKFSLYSVGSISALGSDGTVWGGTGGGVSYPRLDSWSAYSEGDGSILSATLGKELKDTVDGHTAQIADVNTKLQGKSDSSHNHEGVYSKTGHKHAIADVTNLQTTLDAKSGVGHTHDYAASNHTHPYLPLTGGEVAGTLTVKTDNSQGGIKLKDTTITALEGNVIFRNNNSIRFGGNAWDWNNWAGLKYTHSTKRIYLGLADGSAFTANAAQSGGSIYTPGISNLYVGGESNIVAKITSDGITAKTFKRSTDDVEVSYSDHKHDSDYAKKSDHDALVTTVNGKSNSDHNHNATYLGINATAKDSAKLGGKAASDYALKHEHPYLPTAGGALTGALTIIPSGSMPTTFGSGSPLFFEFDTKCFNAFRFNKPIVAKDANGNEHNLIAENADLKARIETLEATVDKLMRMISIDAEETTVTVEGNLAATGSVSSLA